MKRIRIALSVVAVAVFSVSACAQTQTGKSDSPALKRAKELAAIIDAGDHSKAVAFIKENYAASFLAIPMDRHVGFIMQTLRLDSWA